MSIIDRINKAKALDNKEELKAKKIKDLEVNKLKFKLEDMLPEIRELIDIANELVDAGYFRLGGGCPLYSKYVDNNYGSLNFHIKLGNDDLWRITNVGMWDPGNISKSFFVCPDGKVSGTSSLENYQKFVNKFPIFKENFMSDLNEFLKSKGA